MRLKAICRSKGRMIQYQCRSVDLPRSTVRTSCEDIPGTSKGTTKTPSREQQPESLLPSFGSTVKQEPLSPHKLLAVKSASSSPSHKYYSADKKARLAKYESSSAEQDPLAESPAAVVHELLVHDSEYGDPIAEEELLPERYFSDEEEDPLGTTPPDPLATYDSWSSESLDRSMRREYDVINRWLPPQVEVPICQLRLQAFRPERNRGGRDAPPPIQPKTLLKDKPSFDNWR
ncbi:hypothetical protein Pcinc_023230 [Petrolisthes cinctipes]|uniref:Uncharacterized protein n=1 Tax=Petrolisthes cinctipes TaxID=88211 RepID=A0AAE1KG13_PETCI|nr:hypothetical protein Pcinc_023230 [Petrolisthes cinctipes]